MRFAVLSLRLSAVKVFTAAHSRHMCCSCCIIQTAFSFLGRMRAPRGGGLADLKDVLGRWKPWIPPKQDQALQQGGMFVFDGRKCVWRHYDQATGAHADLGEVLGEVKQLVVASAAAAAALGTRGSGGSGEDCGCPS